MSDSEERQKQAILLTAKDWGEQWSGFVPEIGYGATSGTIRHILMQVRSQIRAFVEKEAEFLPSRVVYRRMCDIDDLMIRRVFNAMDALERARLLIEAEASVKKHGGKIEAHKARLIRKLFGIPTI